MSRVQGGAHRNEAGLPNLTSGVIAYNYDVIFHFLDSATARCSEVVFLASLFHKWESVYFVLKSILFKPYILKLNGAEEGFGVPCWRPALRFRVHGPVMASSCNARCIFGGRFLNVAFHVQSNISTI